MRVLLLANMRSGSGRGKALRDAIERDLVARGHQVVVREVRAAPGGRPTSGTALASQSFGSVDVVASIGGDGTINHALGELIDSQRPVYHVPGGNENLFAREFGMDAEPGSLARAIAGNRSDTVDVGLVGGRPFAVMVSIGPDAGVIHRLSQSRGRASGHSMYLGPVFRETMHPHLPRLTVAVDGRTVVGGQRGLVVAANSRQYALRLDPAHRADMRDGLLDVVFLPAGSTAAALLWGVRCMMGDSEGSGHAVYARGASVRVESAERAPWQTDGEAGGWVEPGGVLDLTVRPRCLRVLCP